jgi:hypothetical protein
MTQKDAAVPMGDESGRHASLETVTITTKTVTDVKDNAAPCEQRFAHDVATEGTTEAIPRAEDVASPKVSE